MGWFRLLAVHGMRAAKPENFPPHRDTETKSVLESEEIIWGQCGGVHFVSVVSMSMCKSCLVHHARVTRQTHRHDYDLTWFESSYPTIPMH